MNFGQLYARFRIKPFPVLFASYGLSDVLSLYKSQQSQVTSDLHLTFMTLLDKATEFRVYQL